MGKKFKYSATGWSQKKGGASHLLKSGPRGVGSLVGAIQKKIGYGGERPGEKVRALRQHKKEEWKPRKARNQRGHDPSFKKG